MSEKPQTINALPYDHPDVQNALRGSPSPSPSPVVEVPTDAMIEAAAIALSLVDPTERPLPVGMEMAAFYRELARAALVAALRVR